MNKFIGVSVVFLVALTNLAVGQSGNFNSNTINGNWSNPGSWTQVSGTDADGVPDGDDNVTIINTHTINLTVSAACNTFTLNGNATLNFNTTSQTLTVNGLMTMNGTSSVIGSNNNMILSLQNDFFVPASQSASIGGVQVAQVTSRAFTVSGNIDWNSNTGTKTIGSVTLNNGGLWNSSTGETVAIQNFTMFDGATIDGTGTPVLNIAGNLLVQPSVAGLKSNIGTCTITVTGITNVNGYFIYTISGSGTKTFNNTITVNPGGTWDNIVGEDPVVNCSIVNNGTWPVPTGPSAGRYDVQVNGSYSYSGSSTINMNRLNITAAAATVTNLGSLNLVRGPATNALTVNNNSIFNNGNGIAPAYLSFAGTDPQIGLGGSGSVNFSFTNNTVDYTNTGNQSVFPTTYYNLNGSNSGNKTLTGNAVVTNQLNLSGSTIFIAGTNTMNGGANLIMSGTSELRLAKLAVTVPELTGTSNSLGSSTKITFNGGGSQIARGSASLPYQNIDVITNSTAVDFSAVNNVIGNLTFSNSAIITNNAPLTVGGTFNYGSSGTTILTSNLTTTNLITSAGTINYSGRTILLSSNNSTWTNNGGVFTTDASSTVSFTTGTNQTITGSSATTFSNLTINNSNGVTLSSVNATVSGSLNLVAGRLITGTSILISTGTVNRTSGFVEGNLRKTISSGSPSATFEVGTNTIYSPVDVVFTGVTVTGTLTASAVTGDHPDINGSNIEPLKSINRNWALTNNGITFTSYSSTFSFDPSDVDPLANTGLVNIRRYNSTSWFSTTTGARTATSTQFTGEAAANLPNGTLQAFQIGETIVTTGVFNRLTGARNWSDPTTWIQNRTGSVQFTNLSTTVTGTGTLFLSELQNGDTLVLQTSCDIVRGIVLSRLNDTQLTLTTNATATIAGGYGNLIVPNNNTQIVTIGNSGVSLDINGTTTVTLNQNATINSLNLNTSASPRTGTQNLTHQTGRTLTVQTDVNVNQPGAAGTNAWNINDGSANIGGSVIIGSALNAAAQIAQVNISTGGTLTIQTNLRFNTFNNNANAVAAVLNLSTGSGRVNLGGALTYTNTRGTLDAGTSGSIFNFNRSASGQTLAFPTGGGVTTFRFHHLYANNTSAAGLTIADDLTTTNLTGDLRVQTGLMTVGNFTITGNISRTFQVANSATFRMNGNTGFPTGFGTFDLGTTAPFGTVEYGQTNNQSISGIANYGNLNLTSAQQFTGPSGAIPAMTVLGNLTIGTGGNTRLQGNTGSVLDVTRNITIASGATLNTSSTSFATISVGGNWVNNGTFTSTPGSTNIIFNSTASIQPQLISGTTSSTFPNLTINTTNVTDRVQLSTNTTVSSVLDLRQGGLDMNGLTLSVTNSTTAAITRSSPTLGYIFSEKNSVPYSDLRWTIGSTTGAFIFPFGASSAASDYIPFTFNVTSAGSPATGTVSVSTYSTPPNNLPFPSGVTNLNGPGGINNSANTVDRFWIITPVGFSTTTPTSTLTFTATSSEVGSIVNPRAQRWAPANYWDAAITGQSNPTAFSASVPNVSSYSPWAMAAAASPLPIELISFQASIKGTGVELSWKTASELNNDFFTIERSKSGEKFSDLFDIKGAGTKQTSSSYVALDASPLQGTSYYRLKQTDFDGTVSFSKVVSVEFIGADTWTIFPNPVDGIKFTIKMGDTEINREANVSLQDVNGKILVAGISTVDESAQVYVQPETKLAPGLYVLTVIVGERIAKQKLVVR